MKIAVDKAGVPEFINTLMVFIKQKQVKAKEIENLGDK